MNKRKPYSKGAGGQGNGGGGGSKKKRENALMMGCTEQRENEKKPRGERGRKTRHMRKKGACLKKMIQAAPHSALQ